MLLDTKTTVSLRYLVRHCRPPISGHINALNFICELIMGVSRNLAIYGIHFELKFFDSIEKVGLSGIQTHDPVLTVHTL